jgi:hypothetical protein
MTYWQTYRPWLLRILNERIYLSQHGYCPDLLVPAVSLKNLINYNGYRSDRSLASFIVRKQREIKILIPLNKAHEKQFNILEMAIQQAESQIFQNS